jgi:chromosome segregation ATPase
MSEMDLKKGQDAINDLEQNSARLSELVKQIAEFENTLRGLSELHETSSTQLSQYEGNFAQLKSELSKLHGESIAKGSEALSEQFSKKLSELEALVENNRSAVLQYQDGLAAVEGNLVSAIKIRLGEGLVELSTRLRDLSDDVRGSQKQLTALEEHDRSMQQSWNRSQSERKAAERKILVILAIMAAAIGYLLASSLGLI